MHGVFGYSPDRISGYLFKSVYEIDFRKYLSEQCSNALKKFLSHLEVILRNILKVN